MASRRRVLAAGALSAAALALAVAGCGGDDTVASVTVPPPATTATTPTQVTIPAETAPPPTATATAPSTAGESQEGGGGDEEAIRIPAELTFGAGGVTPSEVKVPAFFTIELSGVSRDGKAHTLEFRGMTVKVPAGGRGQATFEGLRKGRYPVTVDGREGAVTIVSGADPGP